MRYRGHAIGPLLAFFGLTFVFAWAAWVPAAVLFHESGWQLRSLSLGLVVLQTLGAVAPTLAAYLVLRWSGNRGTLRWIDQRYRRWRVHPGWYLAAGLLVPAIAVLSLALRDLLDPGFRVLPRSPLGEMLSDLGAPGIVLILPLVVLAQVPSSPLLEEFGWRGYALPALQRHWTALSSSVALGLIWGVWHLPLMVVYGDPFLPYMLLIVPQTVIVTWVVNGARGSMVIAMLSHASLNTALTTLNAGSWSPPEIVLTWLAALAVIVRYGPRHLAPRERTRTP